MVEKYLKILSFIGLILLGGTTLYAQDENEEKLFSDNLVQEEFMSDFAITGKIMKKHKISGKDLITIKLQIFDCYNKDSNHKEILKKGEKLLTYYIDLSLYQSIDYKINTYANFVNNLNLLSSCYYYVPSKYKYFIKIVRSLIDDNILNTDLVYNSINVVTGKKIEVKYALLFTNYSTILSSINEQAETRWRYDQRILDLLARDVKKNFDLANNYIFLSSESFNDDYIRPQIINYIEKKLFSSDEILNKSTFESLSNGYLNFLISNNDFDKCLKYYNEKIEPLHFSKEKKLKQIKFIDKKFGCLFGQYNFEEAQNTMLLKIKVIEDALNDFKYDFPVERELKNNLVRALYSAGSYSKFNIQQEEDENFIQRAHNINNEFFLKKSIFTYHFLNGILLQEKIYDFKFDEVEKEILTNLELVEKLQFKDFEKAHPALPNDFFTTNISKRPNRQLIYQAEKKKIEAGYLWLQAEIFKKTGRINEAINIYEKYIDANKRIFELEEVELSSVGALSIELMNIIVGYLELFDIYNSHFDDQNIKKIIKKVDKICSLHIEGILSALCIEFLHDKMDYHEVQNDSQSVKKDLEELENILNSKKLNDNAYYSSLIQARLFSSKIEFNLGLANEALDKEEYEIHLKQACRISKEFVNFAEKKLDESNPLLLMSEGILTNYTGALISQIISCHNFNKVEEALSLIDNKIEMVSKQINKLMNISSDFSSYEIKSEAVSSMVNVIVYMKNIDDNKRSNIYDERLKKLFPYSQFGQAVYLTNSIKSSINRQLANDNELKHLLEKRRLFNIKLEEHKKQIFTNPQSDSKIFVSRVSLETELSKIEEVLRERFPEFMKNNKLNFYSVESVQEKLKDHEAMIIYDNTSNYFVYIIQKNRFDIFSDENLNLRKIKEDIQSYRNLLDPQKNVNLKEQKAQLALGYDIYFKPIQKKLENINQLIIVPDKFFANFPIGVFLDKEGFFIKEERGYVSGKYSISYYPSVGSFIELRAQPKTESITYASNFLGIGNPKLQKYSVKKYVSTISDAPLNSRGVLKDTSILKEKFTNIPYTKKELNSLSKLFQRKTMLLSTKATEKQIKALNLKQFDVIAFATHAAVSGSLNGFNEPFLVLTPPEISTDLNDGVLTASEISELNLNAKLVILSACNTASRENEYAPGFSGLVAAFFKAGAKSVIATHWPIEDKAGSIMIVETLRKSIEENIDFTKSLQMTKKEFIEGKYGKKHKNPTYWGSYVVVGN